MDISPQFLANIEYRKKGMSFVTLRKLCVCPGVSCDYIVFGNLYDSDYERLAEKIAGVSKEQLPVVESIIDGVIRLALSAEAQNKEDSGKS